MLLFHTRYPLSCLLGFDPKTIDHDVLVVHGANGGIAGNDVKILSYTDRVINVNGINNHHQLTDIRIGSVAAWTLSQRGPVILIMHQYAVYQTNGTIHSCVQLEHFKNIVDDHSIKARGLQRITTHDGYVFPDRLILSMVYHTSRCVSRPIRKWILSHMSS